MDDALLGATGLKVFMICLGVMSYGSQADFDVADRMAAVAVAHNVPPARIALAWLLHKPR